MKLSEEWRIALKEAELLGFRAEIYPDRVNVYSPDGAWLFLIDYRYVDEPELRANFKTYVKRRG
jgi:hypothetical protein